MWQQQKQQRQNAKVHTEQLGKEIDILSLSYLGGGGGGACDVRRSEGYEDCPGGGGGTKDCCMLWGKAFLNLAALCPGCIAAIMLTGLKPCGTGGRALMVTGGAGTPPRTLRLL